MSVNQSSKDWCWECPGSQWKTVFPAFSADFSHNICNCVTVIALHVILGIQSVQSGALQPQRYLPACPGTGNTRSVVGALREHHRDNGKHDRESSLCVLIPSSWTMKHFPPEAQCWDAMRNCRTNAENVSGGRGRWETSPVCSQRCFCTWRYIFTRA